MKSSSQKLLPLLSNHNVTFYIPPYQRNYEWTDDQCEVLFNDIVKTCEKNMSGTKEEHFFGSITYFQVEAAFGQPDSLVLIDGQQRITSTMLFLAALRDLTDEQNKKDTINNEYLKNANSSVDEYKIKLKQVEADREVYRKIIIEDCLTAKEKQSRVFLNYDFFKNKLRSYRENGGDVWKLVECGFSKFSVITIQLEPQTNPWEKPQDIFESMNSLGKPLAFADLVRNYLLMDLDENTQDEYYNRYWLHLERTIPGQLSNYIRDYMQWKEGTSFKKATEQNYKSLYSEFKNLFGNTDKETLLKDLHDHVDLYCCIVSGGSTGNAKVDSVLSDLRILRASTANSFLLALLAEWKDGKFTDNEIELIFNAFRIYILRRRLLGLTHGENKGFPILVKQMDRLINSQDKETEMFKILSERGWSLRLPNDIDIQNYLLTADFYNAKNSKVFLALIEEELTRSRPNLADQKLQIEHIMPQKLNDAWKIELGPDYETVHNEFTHNIGNLTLIRHNQELGNKSFEDKKAIYRDNSGLQIAKTRIIDQDHWTKSSITSRRDWIINYLIDKVLPLPQNFRTSNNYSSASSQTTRNSFSFEAIGLIGKTITFHKDPSITAVVVSDKEVLFENRPTKLSPLTCEIYTRREEQNASGSYQGAEHWDYNGVKLIDLYNSRTSDQDDEEDDEED